MRMHFPTGNFQYLSLAGLKELFDYFTNTKGLDFKQNSKHGVLICCDISIPDESVARLLEILPPCLESKDIKEEDISPHMKTLKDKFKAEMVGDRLISDLTPKKNYSLTGYNLKCVMRLGVRLDAIHWAIAYDCEPSLRDYMDQLADLRKQFTLQGLVSSANACKKLANR